MATITPTSLAGSGSRAVTEFSLTSSDTFAYDPTSPNSLLYVRNPTAGALTLTITGNAASAAISVKGYGTVSAAAGLSTGSIVAGGARVIPLDSVSEYLAGTITMSGAAGLVASFLKWA